MSEPESLTNLSYQRLKIVIFLIFTFWKMTTFISNAIEKSLINNFSSQKKEKKQLLGYYSLEDEDLHCINKVTEKMYALVTNKIKPM